MDETSYECIVVGGGAAGLSAALLLGRARRRTLVIDAGEQSNLPAHGIGGLLGHDGRPPAELYRIGRDELAGYGVEVRRQAVADTKDTGESFELTLDDGDVLVARRVLLATGMVYRPAPIPGAAERWGGSVFHCPFCHGWEVRDRPLGTFDEHRAGLLRLWSDDVTQLDLDDVVELRGPGTTLTHVVLRDGREVACEGLLVPFTLHQRSPIAADLGARFAAPTPLTDEALELDPLGRTSVPRLYAAGDVGVEPPSIVTAVAAGMNAARAVVVDLLEERS
jgi:thioredoxin reductase